MATDYTTGKWVRGLAEWTEDDTAYLSVAFTWRLPDAYQRAVWLRSEGFHVVAGGPALFRAKGYLDDVAEVPTKQIGIDGRTITTIGDCREEAIIHHNPAATTASRGCPVGCWFCTVPAMEGKTFTLLPDFIVRPVLSDNNLSALPADYQDHIISRYKATDVPLLDANSGFEPRTFDEEVYRRWEPINKGPWRFAYDDQGDGPYVERVMKMLKDVPLKRKRVYVLIGNEPYESCMERLQRVIDWGGDPHVQPLMKLNALEKRPWVRHDWTEQKLKDVARWCNGFVWKRAPFSEYDRSQKNVPVDPGQAALDFGGHG